MSRAEFYIAYDGLALQNNEMNIRDLAPALLALSSLLEESNKIINQGQAKISVNIKASFKAGSFGIDLVVFQEWLTALFSAFNSNNVNGALNLLASLGLVAGTGLYAKKGLIQVLKWIKGRKISRVRVSQDEDSATIEIGEDSLDVSPLILSLLQSQRVRQSLQQVIAEPLNKEGIDVFASMISDGDELNVVEKEDREYFLVPIIDDELLTDREYTTNLQLLNVAFQEDNKWRVSDGLNIYHAEIKDQIFLDKVQRSEIAFSKGDILEVVIHEVQFLTDNGIKTEREIIRVIQHRVAGKTLALPFGINNNSPID